jgi:DNA mismatch repair ATPase MutL
MSNNPETIGVNPETKDTRALERAGDAQREKLRDEHERYEQKSPENNIETAKHEALDAAKKVEREQTNTEKERTAPPAEKRANGPISKAQLDANFNKEMDDVHSQLSAPSRAFSKFIHNKAVEKVSDAAGNTVARPNAILSGAVFAFALTLATFLVAKNLGYPLSGFETIGAFALGWVLGIIYDFLKVMITGRK